MEELLKKLSELYISNVRYRGINFVTEVMFSIDDIKSLTGYERLTIDQFISNSSNLLSRLHIKVSKIDDKYVIFRLDRNFVLPSIDLVDKYQNALENLEYEAGTTGDFTKLGGPQL